MTYRQILQEAIRKLQKAEIEEADNDAWILMSEAFNISRTDYFMKSGDECTDNARTELFDSMIERRVRREPLQYITGHAYFMGYEFRVTPDVLIPRFDTEILVEKSLKYASDGMKVLDMCTGSGCIAISYALQCRERGYDNVAVNAVDISSAALSVAADNAMRAGVDINYIRSDMFTGVSGIYDMILSNPPYIPTRDIEELEPEVRTSEPVGALDGHEDGLFFYRILAAESPSHLKAGGRLIMEIGYNQADDVCSLLEQNKFADIEVIKDLAGHDRVVCGRRI